MYILSYGVNNSHMTEKITFNLYRDAVAAYESLDPEIWKAATVEKLEFSGKKGFQKVSARIPKLFRFEKGTDNTLMLESFCGIK